MAADGRSARTSAQVAIDHDGTPDARSARTSAQVAIDHDGPADARSARVSALVAIAEPIVLTSGGGWGTVGIGI